MPRCRRAILASAGLAGALFAVPAIAKAPLSERIEKWLAQMVHDGNYSVHVQAVDPEVLEALRDVEPMAWDFVMNFAKDNDLQVVDGCLLP